MEELKLNHTYLLKFGIGELLFSATILVVTDKAYHVQWNNGLESNKDWKLKDIMNRNYNMIEDISDFMIKDEKFIENAKTKFMTCPICHGMGTVPDDKSTAGTTTCPLCHGTKMIPETIET